MPWECRSQGRMLNKGAGHLMPNSCWSDYSHLPHPLMSFFDDMFLSKCLLEYSVKFSSVQIHNALSIKSMTKETLFICLFFQTLGIYLIKERSAKFYFHTNKSRHSGSFSKSISRSFLSLPALEYILVSSWTLNGPHRAGYSRQSRAT